MNNAILDCDQLRVYSNAMNGAMQIFQITKNFPKEERYALVDQIRRSSRSVCANIAEGWRKRRYPAAFIAKLSDAEAEAGETQVWIDFANKCGYLEPVLAISLRAKYHHIIAQIVLMMKDSDKWIKK